MPTNPPPKLREVIRPGDERPEWISRIVWEELSWRERDYIVLARRGVHDEEIRRQLYFPKKRAYRDFKRKLREKLCSLSQHA